MQFLGVFSLSFDLKVYRAIDDNLKLSYIDIASQIYIAHCPVFKIEGVWTLYGSRIWKATTQKFTEQLHFTTLDAKPHVDLDNLGNTAKSMISCSQVSSKMFQKYLMTYIANFGPDSHFKVLRTEYICTSSTRQKSSCSAWNFSLLFFVQIWWLADFCGYYHFCTQYLCLSLRLSRLLIWRWHSVFSLYCALSP